jgi:2-polyprenyl-3-methyl-5-hydroxy-6-metoxy-1,4-benzoquinol methylase
MAKINLPQKENLIRTSLEDPVERYYTPLIRNFYLKRLKLALHLLGKGNYEKILEVGYGSGILFPELSKRCQELYGIDIHTEHEKIREMLSKEGIKAHVSKGSVLEMNFEDETFDAVVCISVLEHIENLKKALQEVFRVLKKKGVFVVGFPVESVFMNTYFRLVNREALHHHVSDHKKILNELNNYFQIERLVKFPSLFPLNYSLYCVCKCINKPCSTSFELSSPL